MEKKVVSKLKEENGRNKINEGKTLIEATTNKKIAE